MGILSVYHPDIFEFVNAKAQDANRLKHFNLSVIVDDNFMDAVENNREIELHWPIYDSRGNKLPRSEWNEEFTKKIKARDLWDEIMKMAYHNGEPGVFFEDTLQRMNPANYIENIVASNPCFSGDMKLLTSEGYKRFDELVGRDDISVVSYDGQISMGNKVWCSGIKNTVVLKLSNSDTICCTYNHTFMMSDGESITAENIKIGDALMSNTPDGYLEVVWIEPGETIPVYDFTENINHWGIVNGVVAHNCSEYLAGTIKKDDCKPEDFGGACNLGSLYLHNFVVNPFAADAHLDIQMLKDTIKIAVRMLDNIIDVNVFPNKIYKNYQSNMRTIGLGVTGLADMLAMLGYKYNSEEARRCVGDLMHVLTNAAYDASVDLSIERGAFPFCNKEQHANSYFVNHCLDISVREKISKYGIRNAKILAIAPTGTTSMAYGNNCSSGIEPIFQLDYERKIKVGGQDDSNIQIVNMTDYAYKKWLDMGAPDAYRDVWITALDMSVDDHVAMLSTIVPYVDMSVSKTINIPTEYPFEDTKNVYMQCWKNGVKGCTIFRPNELRQGILIANNNSRSNNKDKKNINADDSRYVSADHLPRGMIIGVDDDLMSIKKTIINGCGKFYLHVDFDEENLEFLETYIDIGSGGGCERNLQFISRLMSLALRAGVPLEAIIDQARSIRPCKAYSDRTKKYGDTSPGTSCPSAIGKALEEMLEKAIRLYGSSDDADQDEQTHIKQDPKTTRTKPELIVEKDAFRNMPKCPECGNPLRVEGGCDFCDSCGFTHCG